MKLILDHLLELNRNVRTASVLVASQITDGNIAPRFELMGTIE
jgi:hypothetical protein